MFRNFPNGWWILPGIFLGSALWVMLICFVVKLLFVADTQDLKDTAALMNSIFSVSYHHYVVF